MDKGSIAWLGTPESRILSIRKFRKEIDHLPFEEAVTLTQKLWEGGPGINKISLDLTNVDAWPTPWDLFGQSAYCANAQVLGAFYTLVLSDHAKVHNIELAIVQDILAGDQGRIVFDDLPLTDLTNSTIITKVGTQDIKEKLGV